MFQWITSSYLLTATAFTPIIGRLAAVTGQKVLLFAELWIFIVGNVIAGSAHSLTQLAGGQLVSGVGGAGLLTLSTIIITELTDERERSTYLNLVNAIFIIADAIGPVLGSAFALKASWRWIYLFNAPCGAFITVFLYLSLHLPPVPARSLSLSDIAKDLDISGMFSITSCLALLIIALNLGGQAKPWSSTTVIGLFAGSAASLIVFVVIEKLWAEKPLAPTRLFTSWEGRNLPCMLIVRTLLFFHLFAMTFYLPLFLHIVLNMSLLVSSLLVIPFLSTASISSAIFSALSSRTGIVRPILLGSLLILLVGLSLFTTLDSTSSMALVMGYSVICGFGFGAGTQITIVVAQEGQDEVNLPTVTALMTTTTSLGGVIGVTLIGAVVSNALKDRLGEYVSQTAKPNYADPASLTSSGVSELRLSTEYALAFSHSFLVLIGAVGLQILLCLFLRPVKFEGTAQKIIKPKVERDSGMNA
ncbi:MFS general substrate transporter [Gymnopus androsaceus JB14]|uniref:MFS general substrate transporter n=1 Tax=Gymnopus androsaceus JB14 TaxID=1447944 RepID=A0A6A4I9I7_9AGAR|nr:MFS general substrate transporter [Gymnopus androsaceus JB14]